MRKRRLKSGEIVYLETDDVIVTSSRLIVFKHDGTPRTLSMRLITSVECVTVREANPMAWHLFLWGTITCCAGIGLILLIIGIVMMQNPWSADVLMVYTAGGQQQFLIGEEPGYIEEVVDAVNKAISRID